MKKTKKVVILILLTCMLTTGCTKTFQDKETEKIYTENILCKPTEQTSLDAYEKNENVKLEKLPKCEEFKITSGGYEGLFTNLFVKPLAWLIIQVGRLVKNYGLSIIILGVLLRLIVMPLSKKTINMSENMKKAQPELEKLEKKYSNRTDQESMLKKNQEMLMIYKKYDIKPFSGCLVSLIQLPLFFAFLEAIQRIPVILEERLLWFDLGTTPWLEIKTGNYYYIIIVILIALVTYLSFKNMNSTSMNNAQAAQTKFMTKMIVVFITFMSFTLNVGIVFYRIATSAFAVIQNYIFKREKNKR